MKKVAISVGDLNGIGIQLILENHNKIKEYIKPIYCIDQNMLTQASRLLNTAIPQDILLKENIAKSFKIQPGAVTKESGHYSFLSFKTAVSMAQKGEVDGIMTLPIHKKSWELADIKYKGHTDALRDFFQMEAIMMLGSPKMYVALYTEHIPLHQVPSKIKNIPKLTQFLLNFYHSIKKELKKDEEIALLGLNPHAGDDGVLGDEEKYIIQAQLKANRELNKKVFTHPVVPDIAFTPKNREKYRYFVAMYHDQGLAPLKALYFDESINISLNLPIIRTSVDHGTAFDIAYTNSKLNNLSYINALTYF